MTDTVNLEELRARLEIAVGAGWEAEAWNGDRGLERNCGDVRLRMFPGPDGTAYGTAACTGGERALWTGAIVDTWGATPARACDRARVRLEQRLEGLAERHDADPPRLSTGGASSDLRRDELESEARPIHAQNDESEAEQEDLSL